MLRKADQSKEYAQAFAFWLAMIPFWNTEADRFRGVAHAATRGRSIASDVVAEAENLVGEIRDALLACDTLAAEAGPGDQRLSLLLSAAAEFEVLLESLHRSLDLMADHVRAPSRRLPPSLAVSSFRPAISKPF